MPRIWTRLLAFVNRLSPIPIDTALVFGLVLLASLIFAAILATSLQRTYTQVTIGEKPEAIKRGPAAEVVETASLDWTLIWIVGLYSITAIVGTILFVVIVRRFRCKFSQARTRRRLRAATGANEVQASLTRLAEAQSSIWTNGPISGAGEITNDPELI